MEYADNEEKGHPAERLGMLSPVILTVLLSGLCMSCSQDIELPPSVPVSPPKPGEFMKRNVKAGDRTCGGVLMTEDRMLSVFDLFCPENDKKTRQDPDLRQVRVMRGDAVPFDGILWSEKFYSCLHRNTLEHTGVDIDEGFALEAGDRNRPGEGGAGP